MIKLLANENFPLKSVNILKTAGYDTLAICSDFPGISDSEVMEIAINEKRIILTFDRDYGELVFKKGYKPIAGIIYFRWDTFQPHEPGFYLLNLFSEMNLKYENMLTVISEKSIRQRHFI